jgi:CBS domain-containing protein
MLVKEIMTKKVFTIDTTDTLKEAINIMCDNNIGCLIVTKNKKVRGIITERDIMRCIAQGIIEYADETEVSVVMTHYTISIGPEQKIEKAIELIKKYKIKKLPVIDNSEKLVGIITASDIVLQKPEIVEKLTKKFSEDVKKV